MKALNEKVYEFEGFRLVPGESLLLQGEKSIPLKPKEFSALVLLVERHGHLVEKSELLEALWGDAYVEEAAVSRCIWAIRNALGDDSKNQRLIQTVPKRGYRFTGEVKATNGIAGSEAIGTNRSNGHHEKNVIPMSRWNSHSAELAIEPAVFESENATEKRKLTLISPKRSKRWSWGYLVATFAIVAVLTLAIYYLYPKASPAESANSHSLAVLPLKSVIAGSRDEKVEFAITDSLIHKISEAKNFNVKQLFAVRKYTELEKDPIDAGRELQVDYVLSSSYQISDDRIRVISQLVNVRTSETEQTFRSETGIGNVFSVQDSVSNEIGNALFAKFGTSPGTFITKRGTENERAYALYHEALYLVDRFTREGSAKAVQLLDQAVTLDPNFAEAWSVQAQAYCQFAHQGGGTPDTVFAVARPSLERALALDSNNAVALMVRGTINRDYFYKLSDASKDLERSIEIDPNNTQAHRSLAGVYYRERRFAEALEEQKKAVDLNPTGILDKWFLAKYQIATGHIDEGIADLRRLTEIEPTFRLSYDSLWRAHIGRGDTAKGYESFIKNKEIRGDSANELDRFQKTYETSGWKGVVKAELDLMRSQDHQGAYSIRKVYIAELASQLGKNDLAFDYLEEALKFRLLDFTYLKVEPLLDPIRSDPRFVDLVKRSGL